MAEVDVYVKKWGDSLAIIIPRDVVYREKLRVDDNVHLRIEKSVNLRDIFGIARGKIIQSVQELKDDAKTGWG